MLQHTQDFDLVALQMPQGWELIIILALVFLLFGAKKMPDAARGIGRSLRILKTETKGLRDGDEESPDVAEANPAQIVTAAETADSSTTDPGSQPSAADIRDTKEPAPSKAAGKE